MSKRKRRDRPHAITTVPPRADAPAGRADRTRWMILGGIALVVVVGVALLLAHGAGVWPFDEGPPGPGWVLGGDPWKADAWDPATEEDRVLDRFVEMHQKGDPDRAALLAEMPGGDGPISEDEFERRAAGHFLRDRDLKIVEVWKGEPGDDGKPRAAAGRYTLITKGSARTPHLTVRDAKGNESPTALSMFNPDIVVEVAGGKVRPVRTEAHRAP